jgi:hypothetical protein
MICGKSAGVELQAMHPHFSSNLDAALGMLSPGWSSTILLQVEGVVCPEGVSCTRFKVLFIMSPM